MFTEKYDKSYLDNLKFFRIRDQPKVERHLKMRLNQDELVCISVKDDGKKVIKVYEIQLNFLKLWTIELPNNEEILDFQQSKEYLFVSSKQNNIHIYKNEEYEYFKKIDNLRNNITTFNIIDKLIFVGYENGSVDVMTFLNTSILKSLNFNSKVNTLFHFNNIMNIGLDNGKVLSIDIKKQFETIKEFQTSNSVQKLLFKDDIYYVLNSSQNLEIYKDDQLIKEHKDLKLDSSMMIIYLQYLIIGSVDNKSVYFFNINKNYCLARNFKLYQDVVSFTFGLDVIFVFHDKPRAVKLYKVIEKNLLDKFFVRFEKFNLEKVEVEKKVNAIKTENKNLSDFYNKSKLEFDEYQKKYEKNYKKLMENLN